MGRHDRVHSIKGRGLQTPMLVIPLGVIGGTLAYGITGLFLGPIVLAVIWELMATWVKEQEGPGGGGRALTHRQTPRFSPSGNLAMLR